MSCSYCFLFFAVVIANLALSYFNWITFLLFIECTLHNLTSDSFYGTYYHSMTSQQILFEQYGGFFCLFFVLFACGLLIVSRPEWTLCLSALCHTFHSLISNMLYDCELEWEVDQIPSATDLALNARIIPSWTCYMAVLLSAALDLVFPSGRCFTLACLHLIISFY